MRNLSTKQRVVGGAVTLLVLGVVGLVYAAWTATGTGEGYAKATEAQDLTTVDVSATAPAELYPGGQGDVVVRISNPNPYPVNVTAIDGNGAITADSGHAGCVTTGVTYTDQVTDIDVPANGTADATLNNAASMSNASDDGCQGATFTIPVSLEGASDA
jgi:hypothetical protein